MVSTGDILSKDHRLLLNVTRNPCSSHILNLVLQDQVCTIHMFSCEYPAVSSAHTLHMTRNAVEGAIPPDNTDCKRYCFSAQAWPWEEDVHEA
jgi:hypothetical protein